MKKAIAVSAAAGVLVTGFTVVGATPAFACPSLHVRDYQEFVDTSGGTCPNIVITKVNSVPNATTWYMGQYWNGSTWVNGASGKHNINDGYHRVTVLTGTRVGTHVRIAAGTAAGIDLEY